MVFSAFEDLYEPRESYVLDGAESDEPSVLRRDFYVTDRGGDDPSSVLQVLRPGSHPSEGKFATCDADDACKCGGKSSRTKDRQPEGVVALPASQSRVDLFRRRDGTAGAEGTGAANADNGCAAGCAGVGIRQRHLHASGKCDRVVLPSFCGWLLF